MLLEGIFLPLTTPFYPDGRVYLRKIEHNVARYSLTPVAGMLVNCVNGEGSGLTDSELRQVLEVAIAIAAPEKVMIAGVARESVFATLQMAENAASLSYDAIAIRGPEFTANPALLSETLNFFEAIADSSPLPVIVLSEGDRRLTSQTLGRLGNHPNIIGAVSDQIDQESLQQILAATSSVTREVSVTTVFAAATARMLRPAIAATGSFVSAESLGGGGTVLASAPPVPPMRTRSRRVGFQLLAGTASQMLSAWGGGATGAAPRLAACAPQACCEVWQAFRDGDLPLAEEKLARIKASSQRAEGPQGIAAIKHGCDLNGYFGGRPRLPLIALTEEQKTDFEDDLAALRN
jgi:4-hydroxy-2-oxoglutarate aldolase